MTDYARLQKIQEEILKEEKSYLRLKKENVLSDLINSTDKTTGKLPMLLYIRQYERDKDFLQETLKKLGYSPKCKEEYNYFYQEDSYKVKLS